MSRPAEALDLAVAALLRGLPELRGKARVALALRRLRERGGDVAGAWTIPLADGGSVRLPRGSRMTWSVAATGGWDRHVIRHCARYIEPGSVVLDVGASLGLWTVPLGRAARSVGARVWCFEPNPENLPWLRANVQRNGLDDAVEIHAVALGARRGSARLGHRERGGGNAVVLRDGDGDSAGDGVDVPVLPLDELEPPARVSFMKLDVEGFELQVLAGARRLLGRDRPAIFGEFNATWIEHRGEDLAAGLRELGDLGYATVVLEERRSAAWRPRDAVAPRLLPGPPPRGAENLLLVPRQASPAARAGDAG